MAIIDPKSLQDLIDTQLSKFKELQPSVTTSTDSMVYLDASVIAEIAYIIQNDAIILTNNAFLAYATWDELTNLGVDRGIPRKDAIKATGTVKFWRNEVWSTDFTIESGTIISTEPSELDGTYIAFKTTVDATLAGQLPSPLAPSVVVTPNGSGRFTPETYKFQISAFDSHWETVPWTSATQVIAATSSVSLSWTAVSWATKYGIYYAIGSGSFTKVWESTSASYAIPDTGALPWTLPMTVNGTWALSVLVPIEAVEAWIKGNVAVWTIINFVNKPIGIDYVTNDTAETVGWTDEENDDVYRTRIKSTLSNNTGKVTVEWYKQTALSVPWVANAQVTINGTWAFRNDILVVITSSSGSWIPSGTLITTVEDTLNADENRAVCDNITVQAPTTQAVNVTVHISEYNTAFTTTYLTTQITAALNAFFPKVPIWGKVYVVEIANAIHDVEWVIDFTLSAPVANVTLSAGQMAIAGTITITY